jgi:hypothetical protein
MKRLLLVLLVLGVSSCYVDAEPYPAQYGYYTYCDDLGNCNQVYERYYYAPDGATYYYHGGVWIRPGHPEYHHFGSHHEYHYHNEHGERRR